MLMAGCVAQNPAFEDSTTGEGETSRGSDVDETTGGRDSGKPKTTGMSATGATSDDDDPTFDDTGEVDSGEHDSSSGEWGSSTSGSSIDPKELTVILLASDPVVGGFSEEEDFEERGELICSGAFGRLTEPLGCVWGLALLSTESVPFSTYVEYHPRLESATFESIDGVPLASSYDALTQGNVAPSFAHAVTGPIQLDNNPSFWWGPGPHCSNWSADDGQGRTLTFSNTAPGMVLDGMNACTQQHRILCACALGD